MAIIVLANVRHTSYYFTIYNFFLNYEQQEYRSRYNSILPIIMKMIYETISAAVTATETKYKQLQKTCHRLVSRNNYNYVCIKKSLGTCCVEPRTDVCVNIAILTGSCRLLTDKLSTELMNKI